MSWSDDRAVDAVHWQILRNHLKPNVWHTSREMLKYKQELDSARHVELNNLASSVQEMKKKLSYLKKTASDVNKIKTVGFENFRKDIKTFESKLSKLKEGGSKKLREENIKQSALIEEIERVKRLALHDVDSKPYNSIEIADFQDFCSRNYGLTGGWSSKDHETFMKIRSRHGADSEDFTDHVVRAMPHITDNAAREHENWFVKFEELKAKQKEAIIKWKSDKKNNCSPDHHKNACSAENDIEIALKICNDRLEDDKNENNNVDESQSEAVDTTKINSCDKVLLKRFREKDRKYAEVKKAAKQKLDSTSDPVTIVTLHGKPDNYNLESSEKLPNVQFSVYGIRNPDVQIVFKYQ